jgi:hypothetical protein
MTLILERLRNYRFSLFQPLENVEVIKTEIVSRLKYTRPHKILRKLDKKFEATV